MRHSFFLNRFFSFLIITIGLALTAFATPTSQTVTLKFDESMFKIAANGNRIESIRYLNGTSSLPADTCLPALPSVSVIIGGPAGSVCDFSYRIKEKHLIFEDVQLPLAPQIVSSAELHRAVVPSAPRLYSGSTYPAEVCTYRTRSPWADATDFHFCCSPIIYDAPSRSLYLIDELELTLNYSDAPAAKLSAATAHALTPRPSFLSAPLGYLPIDSTIIKPSFPVDPEPTLYRGYYDYVIITSEALKPAFDILAQWKSYKGIYTLVQTVEEIDQKFSGKDIQEKIKQYLASLNKKRSTEIFPMLSVGQQEMTSPTSTVTFNMVKYVLLGGGDSIIPPRYCAGNKNANQNEDKSIPTDLYFACLNDPYDWDKNGNGIYGEQEDSIHMNPSFALTRIPVNDLESANKFVKNLIEYEHFPKWKGNMLMGGTNLGTDEESVSAYKGKAKRIYDEIISHTNLKHETDFLFDDYNSFGFTDNDVVFSKENIYLNIKSGYNFIDITTHGTQTSWVTQNQTSDADAYSTANYAASQPNETAHTIITAFTSCYTSAFDKTDKMGKTCLAEKLISQGNNIIGYIGSSRAGYFSKDLSYPGPSYEYEFAFYDSLLFSSPRNVHFGTLMAKAKYDKVNESNDWNYNRWLQYSINPFGDPEMPIFTSTPLTFDNVAVTINGKSIEVQSNEPGSKVTVAKVDDGVQSYLKSATKELTYSNLPELYSVCITKDGFQPWHYVYRRLSDGTTQALEVGSIEQYMAEQLGFPKESSGSIIKVYADTDGFHITTSTNALNSASILLTNSVTGESYGTFAIENGPMLTSTIPFTSNMPKIIRVVISLIVDGQVVDSTKLLYRR